MKKLVLVILSFVAVAAAHAQQSKLEFVTVKKINIGEVVTSIKVYNQVEVILTADSATDIKIVGEKSATENTQLRFEHGELAIMGLAENTSEKVVVYVPAIFLQSIYIHGPSNVTTASTLANTQLDVIINGTGSVDIRTTGLLSQNTIEDYQIDLSASHENI